MMRERNTEIIALMSREIIRSINGISVRMMTTRCIFLFWRIVLRLSQVTESEIPIASTSRIIFLFPVFKESVIGGSDSIRLRLSSFAIESLTVRFGSIGLRLCLFPILPHLGHGPVWSEDKTVPQCRHSAEFSGIKGSLAWTCSSVNDMSNMHI